MSGPVRAVDASGAAWPVTGRCCPVCQMPLDSAAGQAHPSCAPVRAISASREAAALSLLTRELGAVASATQGFSSHVRPSAITHRCTPTKETRT